MTRAVALLAAFALAGCTTLLPSTESDYDIHVRNGTTLAVGVRVNGNIVRVFQAAEEGTVPAGTLDPLPWTVDAVTSSGRVLETFDVATDIVGCTHHPDGGTECSAAFARVDLSCGRFDMAVALAGDIPDGPPPGPGEPGDCVP